MEGETIQEPGYSVVIYEYSANDILLVFARLSRHRASFPEPVIPENPRC